MGGNDQSKERLNIQVQDSRPVYAVCNDWSWCFECVRPDAFGGQRTGWAV